MSRLPRICYVIPSLGIGGTEHQLLHLMRGVVKRFELTVVCTREPGTMYGDVRRIGAYVRVLNGKSGWDITLRRKLNRVFASHRPDIVHSFLFGFDLAANQAARDQGVPVVISSRRQLATWKKGRHIRLQQKANRLVDAVIANSQAVAEFAIAQEGLSPDRIRVIHNGIDATRFVSNADRGLVRRRYGVPADCALVGTVANFSPVKDYDLFIEMARMVRERRRDAHFLTVGSGPLRNKAERALARTGLSEHTTMLATLSELNDIYGMTDVFVLCSKAEGFPNAVMEAMAARRPVVAAAVGGIPELVEDGETGQLIASRNPSEFADAVVGLLDDPDRARRFGEQGHERVCTEFTVDKMAAAYEACYQDLLRSRIHAKAQ